MRVGFLQLNSKFLDKEGNLEKVEGFLNKVNAELMVLPELFNTGYNFSTKRQLASVAEEVPKGPTTQRLIKLSKKKDMCIVAGIVEKNRGKFYNSAVVIDKRFLGVSRKVHLFYKEKKFFEPGKRFKVFPTRGIKLGVMICYDWCFPESARTLSLMGADIIAHPAALVMPYCPDYIRTRAFENGVFIITADRVGSEKGLRYRGLSQITGPKGEILYRASKTGQEIKVLSIDPSLARNKELSRYNNIIKDRMPNTYKSR